MTREVVPDPVTTRRDQRAIWDAVSPGWQRWSAAFERGAAPVTERLLELGGVRAGQSVLDIGTGLGEPALTAAARVGPAGSVLGIDLSPVMVAAARARSAPGVPADFAVGDVETMALPARSFDVVLSRWALGFAADRVATLRAAARLLRPSGVLAAAVWGRPELVPVISLAFAVIAERFSPSGPPPGPGPFAMADPARTAAEFAAAGFADVTVTELAVTFELDSVPAFAEFARDILPPGMVRLLAARSPAERDAVWAAFAAAAARFRIPDGRVEVPATTWCVRAVAP
ncbi:class I SAM-dependent methyltransferase [Amycolatopsis sp. NPDC005003]